MDGQRVSADGVLPALIGSDEVGSTVELTVQVVLLMFPWPGGLVISPVIADLARSYL